MSDQNHHDQPPHQGADDALNSDGLTPASIEELPSEPVRAASITLSGPTSDAATGAELLDPANQSLADALRITFRLVQFAIIVLVALFVLSGLQSVSESERGIELRFGKVVSKRGGLEPGFHFTLPYPIGELVKIENVREPIDIDEAFWPDPPSTRRPSDAQSRADALRPLWALDPIESGSNITADLNLAHTQWKVSYRKRDVTAYAEHINPRSEKAFVEAAIERGVVVAMSETTIDQLLQPSDPRELTERVRLSAQQVLDAASCGIEIDTVQLIEKSPPGFTKSSFDAVFSARSEAQKARQEAESERTTRLGSVAGLAARVLIGDSNSNAVQSGAQSGSDGARRLGLIDRYEAAIELGDTEQAGVLLTQIDDVLQNQAVVIDGEEIEPGTSGEVASILAQANSERNTIATREEANRNVFLAKLDQFEANSSLMLTADWNAAWGEFYSNAWVEIFRLPVGSVVRLDIDRDPRIDKEAERAYLREQNRQALEAREEAFQRRSYELDSGFDPDSD